MVVITRRMVGILALLVVLTGSFVLDTRRVDAVDGTVGPITFTVTRDINGQRVAIHAQAADGVLIYELRVHLCVPNANVRTNFDFGFQGKKCTNAPVGAGDIEQVVASPTVRPPATSTRSRSASELSIGSTISATTRPSTVGPASSATWSCGRRSRTAPRSSPPRSATGLPGGGDSARPAPAGTPPPPTDPPATHRPPAAGGSAGGPTSAGGASCATNGGGAAGANGSGTVADGSEQALAATGTAVPSPRDLSPRSRVLLAAGATAGAAVLIAWIVARGIRKTREI